MTQPKPSRRCLICSRDYTNNVNIPDRCAKCGRLLKLLEGRNDVVLRFGFGPLLELCQLARDRAQVLAATEAIYLEAPLRVQAIRKRIQAQREKRKTNGIAINWHELVILGYWGCQSLEEVVTYFPDKMMGKLRRILGLLLDLERQHPEKEALSASLSVIRDEAELWHAKHMSKENAVVTDEAMHDLPDSMKATEDIGIAGISVQSPGIPKILGPDGKEVLN